MKTLQAPDANTVCPSPDALAAFSRGQLALEVLEEVGSHITSCPRCGPALQALPDSDPLLTDLRGCIRPDRVLDEPECGRLEARAKALAAEPRDERETWDYGACAAGAPDATEPAFPVWFGKYQLLARLGKGGMGVVYQALDGFNRVVALKMVRAGAHADPQDLVRFRVEAAAVARLNHPDIVTVHDFGEHDGQPFFTMEFAPGGSLADRLAADRPFTADEAAEWIRRLARAVHAAHEQRIVHRDLKPGNVLLRADGTPLLTDFGLAKLLDAADGLTATDAILGTVAYMAPEQAAGQAAAVGPAADTYALGAMLYELLCGGPPFQGDNRLDTLHQLRTREPERPSRRRRGVPADLEAVCLKCLEKSPARRYASAAALAEEMDRYLRREPTLASRWYRTKRLVRAVRRRSGLTASVCLGGLLVALAVAFGSQAGSDDPGRSSPPSTRPDDASRLKEAMQQARAELVKGKSVELLPLGVVGADSRWHLGQGQVRVPADKKDGLLQLSSLAPGLFEMLDDPGIPAYQVVVEMRQVSFNSNFADTGLYFGHDEHQTPEGRQHFTGRATFADLGKLASAYADETGRPCSRFNLSLHYEGTSAAQPFQSLRRWGPYRSYSPDCPAQGPGPWRNLVLDVGPEKVRARWETDTLALNLRDEQVPFVAALNRNFPELKPLRIELTCRRPVGLYLCSGSIQIRRFFIGPPQPETP